MKKLDPKILKWEKKIGKARIKFLREFKSPEEFQEYLKERNEEIKKQINQTVEIVFKALDEEQNEQIN